MWNGRLLRSARSAIASLDEAKLNYHASAVRTLAQGIRLSNLITEAAGADYLATDEPR